MSGWRYAYQGLLILVFSAMAVCAPAQTPAQQGFEPEVGQAGKDVIWVPSPQELVEKMLDMAKVAPGDFVFDLGSGDGRTVIAAAKRGARALGVEYNPDMVALSRRNAAGAGVGDRAAFVQEDIFQTDLSRATVITMFLLTEINLKLRPAILSLKPGTRIVTNSFRMGDWTPDETAELGCETYCTAYLWVVPARVEGKWQLPQGELTLKQEFQMVSGTLRTGKNVVPISRGRLRGDQIRFVTPDSDYRGRVGDKTIEGTARTAGKTGTWKASR